MIRIFYTDLKAWLRGEKRVQPLDVTGRVFINSDPEKEIEKTKPFKEASVKGTMTINARVIRKDGSKEDLGEIGKIPPRE